MLQTKLVPSYFSLHLHIQRRSLLLSLRPRSLRTIYVLPFGYCFVGHMFNHPIDEVVQLSRENGMEGRVRVVACGAGPGQLTDIQLAFEDCIHSGYWLVLQNAHLVDEWNRPLIDLLKVSITSDVIAATYFNCTVYA